MTPSTYLLQTNNTHLLELSHQVQEQHATNCEPNRPWQTAHHETCNIMHELPLSGPYWYIHPKWGPRDTMGILGHGYYRDVWWMGDPKPLILKTLRYQHAITRETMTRSRIDALAMEMLTASSSIANVYSYCGSSGLFELAEGGDMGQEVYWEGEMTPLRKLQVGK